MQKRLPQIPLLTPLCGGGSRLSSRYYITLHECDSNVVLRVVKDLNQEIGPLIRDFYTSG